MPNRSAARRLLIEGVMLCCAAARGQTKARVAQTIIASSDVNPLEIPCLGRGRAGKFRGNRPARLSWRPRTLREAFRNLTDHELRTWTALQAALRRMIDRFDPNEIGRRRWKNVGLLESLIAGGRSAKLWRLYQERYRRIACAAEDRFHRRGRRGFP